MLWLVRSRSFQVLPAIVLAYPRSSFSSPRSFIILTAHCLNSPTRKRVIAQATITLVTAASISAGGGPRIRLDSDVFTGVQSGDVAKCLGILFAKSTAGELRLQLPKAVDSYPGYYDATVFGPSCVAKILESAPVSSLPPETIAFLLKVAVFSPNNPSSEDCLTVNIVKPASVKAGAKLPVVV